MTQPSTGASGIALRIRSSCSGLPRGFASSAPGSRVLCAKRKDGSRQQREGMGPTGAARRGGVPTPVGAPPSLDRPNTAQLEPGKFDF